MLFLLVLCLWSSQIGVLGIAVEGKLCPSLGLGAQSRAPKMFREHERLRKNR